MAAAHPAVREAALAAHAAGLCVVPPREDGSKAPIGTWKRNTSTRPTTQELDAWYGPHTGIGLICGAVSGGLEMLEFEGRAVAEGRSQMFLELARDTGLADLVERIRAGYQERTPSGGIHLLYRVPTSRPNTRLAQRRATPDELAADPHDRVKVLIETRGEGGYTIVAPSDGSVHPLGGPWVLEAGGFEAIATITDDERDRLFALARMLDEIPPADGLGSPPRGTGEERPGDRYNAAPDVGDRTLELLERHGWTVVRRDRDVVYLRRPGKEGPGISASLGYVAPGVLRVFSTSTAFGTEKAYSPFGVYAVLEHGGDFRAAARPCRR
jgi:putative DNA primase/helicase